MHNIYQPYMELIIHEEKLENSEKEKKDLMAFYLKFQSLKATFESGF